MGKLADGFIARWNFSSDIFYRYFADPLFSVWLGWLPSYGRGETVAFGWWTTGLLTGDGLKHIILPAVTLAIFQIALVMRLVRSEMLEVMRTDYIRFARARGVPKRKIFFRHALKNTLLPVITITGLQIGGIIAFSIVTETVFQWPAWACCLYRRFSLQTSRSWQPTSV